MTHENEQRIGDLSTEVVGSISDTQKQELTILGLNLIQQRNLDPENPKDVQDVQLMLEDCIYRGLDVQKRNWFSKSEAISPIFELGLNQRVTLINNLGKLASDEAALRFITPDEYGQIKSFSSFDPDLSEAEDSFKMLNHRKMAVMRFHNSLFSNSQFSQSATEIKNSIEVDPENNYMLKYEDSMKNNRLYANLLANLALYHRPRLNLDPKDIAALSDIWKDPGLAEKQKWDLVGKMKNLASNFGISEDDIEKYTLAIIERMSLEIASGQVTLEELQASSAFALQTKELQNEGEEFETEYNGDKEALLIPEEDYLDAKNATSKLINFFNQINKLMSSTDSIDEEEEEEEDDRVDEFLKKEYLPFLRNISALELAFIYIEGEKVDDALHDRIEEDLTTYVPFETYVDALSLLSGEDFITSKSGEVIPELKLPEKEKAYTAIKDHVILNLLIESVEIDFKASIARLPIKVLDEYLNKVVPSELTQSEINSLIDIEDDKWFKMAISHNLGADLDVDKSDEITLIYSPDSEYLRYFFENMPSEKREAISRRLQHVIAF